MNTKRFQCWFYFSLGSHLHILSLQLTLNFPFNICQFHSVHQCSQDHWCFGSPGLRIHCFHLIICLLNSLQCAWTTFYDKINRIKMATQDWLKLVRDMLWCFERETKFTLRGISDDFKQIGLSFDPNFRFQFLDIIVNR